MQGLLQIESKSKDQQERIVLLKSILLVLLWYSSSVCCVTTSKTIIVQLPFPFLLCTIQFLCATVAASIYLKVVGNWKYPSKETLLSIIGISIAYTFGFVTLNTAILNAAASFVETVRAAEAFTTVIMGFLLLKESVSFRILLTLIPTCGGVAISCISDHSGFSTMGLLFALLSNFCFSMRSVFAKLYIKLSLDNALDQINLFNLISAIGLCILIPLTYITEGSGISKMMFSSIDNQSEIIYHQTYNTNDVEIIMFIVLLIFNGCMFACYNIMSYIILQRTDLVTHAVLNVFRRVFSIFITAFYFGMGLTTQNAVGVSIAISGVVMYGYLRSSRSEQQQQQP